MILDYLNHILGLIANDSCDLTKLINCVYDNPFRIFLSHSIDYRIDYNIFYNHWSWLFTKRLIFQQRNQFNILLNYSHKIIYLLGRYDARYDV